MQSWLPAALFALFARTAQRLLSTLALASLGTGKFYLLSAPVSLLAYTPYLLGRPAAVSALLPAFGLACLMAVTFGGHYGSHSSIAARFCFTTHLTEPSPHSASRCVYDHT